MYAMITLGTLVECSIGQKVRAKTNAKYVIIYKCIDFIRIIIKIIFIYGFRQYFFLN